MKHLSKSILVTLLLILSFLVKAQQAPPPPPQTPGPPQPLPVQGKIEDDNGPLNGAVITVVQGGKTITTITTGADGKYAFQIPLGNDYMVSVTKQGFVTKKFSISTKGVPP